MPVRQTSGAATFPPSVFTPLGAVALYGFANRPAVRTLQRNGVDSGRKAMTVRVSRYLAGVYAAVAECAALAPSSIAAATTANASRQADSCSDCQAVPAIVAIAAISVSPTTE